MRKNEDIGAAIARWEAKPVALERDYQEKVSERMRIGILISMVPDDLQEMLLQQEEHFTEYRVAREKVMTLVDTRMMLKDPNAMDAYITDEGGWNVYDENSGHEVYFSMDAVGKGTAQCYRCIGFRHMAAQCATPKGMGKGGGKDSWKGGAKSKGKGKDPKGAGKGKTRVPCPGCMRLGHGADNCWTLHPELWRKGARRW